ncbi:MAG: DUF1801 domain-containing protein [Candidatus Thermoplasmatota archaeon]|jgi:hypothetical protein|nr:DUF1801 domain-containing protein [Candidatus Thermoplasmatota archaeon]
MKKSAKPISKAGSNPQLIDDIIRDSGGWKGEVMSQLRKIIKQSDKDIVEEVKWKKPSNPRGVPVWSHYGIICIGNILKNAVRLTFPDGAKISDPERIFNTRMDSKTVRAVDFHEGETIDEDALKSIVSGAVDLNTKKHQEKENY